MSRCRAGISIASIENLFNIYNSTCFLVVEKTKVYRNPKVIAHANQLLSMCQASFYTLYIFILATTL